MALRVAVIGISNKGSQNLPELPSAPGDALRLLNILREYPDSETDFFTALEPEHTYAHILREGLVRFFSETKPADNVMLVFEGHGLEIDQKSYLLAADYPGYGTSGTLAVEEVMTWMDFGKPLNRILLLDACHSGQGRNIRSALGGDVLFPAPGVSVLSACDLNEGALELEELGGGLFSFMAGQALSGAAGTEHEGHRKVTVAGLFQFVAREVPAWLEANRSRLCLPDSLTMTPRCISDLRGDPVLTTIPLVRRPPGLRLTLAQQYAGDDDVNRLSAYLDPLQALARTVARRACRDWGNHNLFLDADQHTRELELLLGRCSADLQGSLTSAEAFVLRVVVCTHDLGLLETHYQANGRFQRAADWVRSGMAQDLPVVLPDGILKEAVARTIEGLAGDNPVAELLWQGVPVRTKLLSRMFGVAHRLVLIAERLAEDVGGGEIGRAWVRRACLSGVSDWEVNRTATVHVVPGVSDTEWTAIERWHANATSVLVLGGSQMDGFGPLWIDVKR